VRRFIDRDLLALLGTARAGEATPGAGVRLASNRILANHNAPTCAKTASGWRLDEQEGWLVAGASPVGSGGSGWHELRQHAVAGFCAMAGVHLVRGNCAVVDPLNARCEIHEDGTILIPTQSPQDAVRYDLTEWPGVATTGVAWGGCP
jgi:hypothetical protein